MDVDHSVVIVEGRGGIRGLNGNGKNKIKIGQNKQKNIVKYICILKYGISIPKV